MKHPHSHPFDRIQYTNDIGFFLPTLESEVRAFMETRTEHDRMRADKAINYLEVQIAELRKYLNNAQLRSDE